MTKPQSTRPKGRRHAMFACCAVSLGLLPFVIAEVILRVAGLGTPTSYMDPYVSFSQAFPLFEYESSSGNYKIAKHHHYFFGSQQFSRKKATNAYRVFCLGGSTVLGHPYETPTAFPKWLEIELNARAPDTRHEVINCGGMSYASYRLVPILQEVLHYEADLIIVMTGHNEFLEDRTYQEVKHRTASQRWIDAAAGSLRVVTLARQAVKTRPAPKESAKDILPDRVDAKLDHESGYASYHRDPQWWRDIANHHALNLRVIVQLCRQAGVPLLLVNPGSNLRDCPPFKSEHRSGISTPDLARWNELFKEGETLEVGRPEAALQVFEKAKAVDDQHALLQYRIARCLDQVDRDDEARAGYLRAKELDICPLRMLRPLEQNTIDVANSTSTPLVDVAELLHGRSDFRIAGNDWYVDHVHPSIRGHQLIARALTEKLIALKLLPATSANWGKPARRWAYRAQMEDLGQKYLFEGRRRLEWLESWARRDRLRDDVLPVGTRGLVEMANGFVEFGELAESRMPYEVALHADPTTVQHMMDRALQLFRSGRNQSALALLKILESWSKSRSPVKAAQIALAVVLLDSGQSDATAISRSTIEATSSDLDARTQAWLEELPD